MLLTSLRIEICGIRTHSSKSLSSLTVVDLTGRAEMALCSMSHTCSMGLRSGNVPVNSFGRWWHPVGTCWSPWPCVDLHCRPLKWSQGLGYSASVRADIHVQDLINVPLVRQAAVINDMKVSLALHADPRPHNDVTLSKAIMACVANRCKTLMGHSPHPCPSIREAHTKSGLIGEQYRSPIIQRPCNVTSGPLKACLKML